MWKYTDATEGFATDGNSIVEVGSSDWFSAGLDIKAENNDIHAHDYERPSTPPKLDPKKPSFTLDLKWTSDNKFSVMDMISKRIYAPYNPAWETASIQAYIDAGKVKAHNWDAPPAPPLPTFEALKAAKILAVSVWRDNEEKKTPNTIEVDGLHWDCDPSSHDRIQKTMTSTKTIPFWTDADNVDRDVFDLQNIHDAIVELGFKIHSRQREMKSEIDLITEPESLRDYPIGWK